MKLRALGEARWILGILALAAPLPSPGTRRASFLCRHFSIFALFLSRSRAPAPADENLAVAPADGVVVEIKEAGEDHLIKGKVKRIAIFRPSSTFT